MKNFAFALAILLALTACGEKTETQAPASQQTETTNNNATAESEPATVAHNPNWETLLVGSEISYTPFEYQNSKGQPVGFEVELLSAIAQAEQFNVLFVHSPRENFEETLNTNKFSIFASALSISPERVAKVDFTQPYMDFNRSILILDTPENKDIKTISDLKGKKIATNKSSQSNIKLISQISGSDNNAVLADSFFLSMTEMYKGNAVGVMGDDAVLNYYDKQNPDIKTRILRTDEPTRQLAFAVKKGNTDLLNKLNSGLNKIKKDGTYDKLVTKWFKK